MAIEKILICQKKMIFREIKENIIQKKCAFATNRP